MAIHYKNKTLRIILVCIGILLAAGGGVTLWLNGNYKRIIQQKLPAISAKATDSMYRVKTGDVTIDLPGRKIVIANLELLPDPQHFAKLKKDYNLPKLLYRIKVQRLTISGIAWARFITDKVLACDSISLLNPVVRITRLAAGTPADSNKEEQPPRIEAILAKQVAVINPDIAFINETPGGPVAYAVKGGGILLSDWRFDLKEPNDSTRLLYASRTVMQLGSFNINDKKAVYNISTGQINYSDEQSNIRIADLRIKPALSREAFYRQTGYQKEIYDVTFPDLSLDRFDWKRLLYNGEIIAQQGAVRKASINIYMSRVPPPSPENKRGKYPHQLLKKLKLPIYIPMLQIGDGRFAYTEKNQKTMEEGVISMNTINGSVANITNMPARISANKTCSIMLRGLFKGSPIQAAFKLMLDSRKGAFSVDGEQGAMDGTKLNDITRPLALAEMQRLKLKKVAFHIDGDESGARGALTMLYEDLKVALLKVKDGEEDKKDVSSFLANHLFSFDQNPMPRREVRVVHPVVQRDATKSFFNLIWKTIFTGVLQTASRDLIKLDKMVDKRQRKQEAERREKEKPNPRK